MHPHDKLPPMTRSPWTQPSAVEHPPLAPVSCPLQPGQMAFPVLSVCVGFVAAHRWGVLVLEPSHWASSISANVRLSPSPTSASTSQGKNCPKGCPGQPSQTRKLPDQKETWVSSVVEKMVKVPSP